MEQEAKEKVYISSKGEVIKLKDLETTHLSNALSKAYRDSYSAKNKKEFEEHLKKINDLKEEMHKRINTYYESLED